MYIHTYLHTYIHTYILLHAPPAGVPGVQPERLAEGLKPQHCALSLVGEPIMYPEINTLVQLLHRKGISTFLVTNAQFPDAIRCVCACVRACMCVFDGAVGTVVLTPPYENCLDVSEFLIGLDLHACSNPPAVVYRSLGAYANVHNYVSSI